MTYEEDIDAREHHVAYYVAFDGIAERFSTHHPDAWPNWNPSETFIDSIIADSISGGGQSLDRAKGLVMPGGFGFRIASSATTRLIIRRRGGTDTALSGSLSYNATSVTIISGTDTYADGTTVHVDKEAITLGTHSGSGTYAGCTRGARNTQAAAHLDEAVVSDVPRHWLGRRCVLWAVNLETGTERALRAGISSHPKHDNDIFSFSCTDLMTVLNKRLMTGWEEQPIVPGYPVEDTAALHPSGYSLPALTFKVADPRQVTDGGSGGFVLFNVDGGTVLTPIYPGQSQLESNGLFNVYWTKMWGTGPDSSRQSEVMDATNITVRQVEYLEDRLGIAALKVMLSIYGDGANHATYDVMAGRAPDLTAGTDDLVRKRGGAGIPSDWVDVASWEAMPGPVIRIVIDEEMSLRDFLVNEILWRSGGYAYVTPEGKLAWKQYTPLTVRGSLPTLDASDEAVLTNVVSEDNEENQISRVAWHCNYVPGAGYTRKVVVGFEDTIGLHDDEPETELELFSKSVWVGGAIEGNQTSDPVSELQLRAQVERLRARYGQGGRRLKKQLPWDKHVDFVEGYRFALTDPYVPDHEGGLGLVDFPCEVVGTSPDYGAGTVNADMEEVPVGVRIAPAAVVDSYNAGTMTATLKSTGVHGDGRLFDDNPGLDLGYGFLVRIYDATASPPHSSSTTENVVASTANTITFANPPTTLPADGDIITLEDSAETFTTANDAGADVHDYAFGADASDRIGTGGNEREANRWQ